MTMYEYIELLFAIGLTFLVGAIAIVVTIFLGMILSHVIMTILVLRKGP